MFQYSPNKSFNNELLSKQHISDLKKRTKKKKGRKRRHCSNYVKSRVANNKGEPPSKSIEDLFMGSIQLCDTNKSNIWIFSPPIYFE